MLGGLFVARLIELYQLIPNYTEVTKVLSTLVVKEEDGSELTVFES